MVKTNRKMNIITVTILAIVLFGFFLLNVMTPNPEVLDSERRQPSKLPELTLSSILSGSFMAGFEDWASDSFVYRDELRTVRAFTVLRALFQTDKSGIYLDSAVGAGSFDTIDSGELLKTVEKLQGLLDLTGGASIYFAAIPAKDEYAEREYPSTSFGAIRELLESSFTEATHIDISLALNADSWYKTDLHWDQSKLRPVVEALAGAMGFEAESDFNENLAGYFDGVFTGQLALPMQQDTGVYLTSDAIAGAAVSYIDLTTLEWISGEMYDLEAFNGRDPYDMFLGGAQPLVKIENAAAESDRELFIFRDSFGGSLAPLLTASYSTITLIDLRYIDARILDRFIEIGSEADVLFLYSTEVLGTPGILLTGE